MSRPAVNPILPAVRHLHPGRLQTQLRLAVAEGRGGKARLGIANAAVQFMGDAMSPSIRKLADRLAQGEVLESRGWTFSSTETQEPWQLGIRAANASTGEAWCYCVVLSKEQTKQAREIEERALQQALSTDPDGDFLSASVAASQEVEATLSAAERYEGPRDCPLVSLVWASPTERLPLDDFRSVYVHDAVLRLKNNATRTAAGLDPELSTAAPIIGTAARTAEGLQALEVIAVGIGAAGLESEVRSLADRLGKLGYECFSEGASRLASALGLALAFHDGRLPGFRVRSAIRDVWEIQLAGTANRSRADLSRMISLLAAAGHGPSGEAYDAGGSRRISVSSFGRAGTLWLETQTDDVLVDYALDPKGMVSRLRITAPQEDPLRRPNPEEEGYVARMSWDRKQGFKVGYTGPFHDLTITTAEQTLAVLCGVAEAAIEEYGSSNSEGFDSSPNA